MPACDYSLIKIEDITFDTLNIWLKHAMGWYNWVFIGGYMDFTVTYTVLTFSKLCSEQNALKLWN